MTATPVDEFGVSIEDLDVQMAKLSGLKIVDKTEDDKPPAPKFNEEDKGNAQKALVAEALEAGGVAFEYEGVEYAVPKAEDWDIEVLEAAEDGKFVTSVRVLLGDAQWALFKKKKRTNKQLQEFFEVVQKALGTKPGE